MEWNDLQNAIQVGRADRDRAANNLNYARQRAANAIRSEDDWSRRGDKLREPLKRLLKAIQAQPHESVDHLKVLGQSFGRHADLKDVALIVNEALDLISLDGRKPLPIRHAVQWLLIHYHGQGNRVSNTLYGPDGVADKPSDCVSWLTNELRNMRPETHDGEVYDLLRSPKIRAFIADLQKLPAK
jgi:hypothetical protein